MRILAQNRKAHHEYHIVDRFEAGMVLTGGEVKSLRAGRVSFTDSYCRVVDEEVWLQSLHIATYEQRGYAPHDPLRMRKLLLHRQEIRSITRKVREKGMALIPLSVGLSQKGFVKCTIALCRGKQLYQKKQTIREKDLERETQRSIRDR